MNWQEPPGGADAPEMTPSMHMDEFRELVRDVLNQETGVSELRLGGRWQSGTLVLQPGDLSTQAKEIPLESFFHKIVMLRDRLRVLEQKINGNAKLSDEDKVELQQYITRIYGSLTTFNVLFQRKEDQFRGSGSRE